MSGETLDKLTENLSKVDELRERLTRVMTQRSTHNAALDGPNQELFGKAATAYWQDAIHNPAKLIEQQMGYWSKTMAHFVEAQKALTQGGMSAPEDTGPTDRARGPPLCQPDVEPSPLFQLRQTTVPDQFGSTA